MLAYAIGAVAKKHRLVASVAFVKPAILQENLSKSFGLLHMFGLFDHHQIIICTFNNIALKKGVSGKAHLPCSHSECPVLPYFN